MHVDQIRAGTQTLLQQAIRIVHRSQKRTAQVIAVHMGHCQRQTRRGVQGQLARSILRCDQSHHIQVAANRFTKSLNRRTLQMLLAAETAKVNSSGEGNCGVKLLVVRQLQPQLQPLTNVSVQSCRPAAKALCCLTVVVVTATKGAQIDLFCKITRQQKAGFCVEPLQTFGKGVHTSERQVAAGEHRTARLHRLACQCKRIPECLVIVAAQFPCMCQNFRTSTPLVQIGATQIVAVVITVAAQHDVPVLDIVAVTAAERPHQATLVGPAQSRVAENQTVARTEVGRQTNEGNRIVPTHRVAGHMAPAKLQTVTIPIQTRGFRCTTRRLGPRIQSTVLGIR